LAKILDSIIKADDNGDIRLPCFFGWFEDWVLYLEILFLSFFSCLNKVFWLLVGGILAQVWVFFFISLFLSYCLSFYLYTHRRRGAERNVLAGE
jgi:hypothetical protein